jgi:hypothetical protein
LEDNKSGGCLLDPKKSKPEIFQRKFELENFGRFGVSRYAATPLTVSLSPVTVT